jgi:hypothetical protein
MKIIGDKAYGNGKDTGTTVDVCKCGGDGCRSCGNSGSVLKLAHKPGTETKSS